MTTMTTKTTFRTPGVPTADGAATGIATACVLTAPGPRPAVATTGVLTSGGPPARAAVDLGPTAPAGATAPAPAFRGLAYDAFDALAVAEFWAAVLRAEVAPGASTLHAELLDGSAAGLPRLVFRQVTEGRELRTPVHLQLTTGDLDGEVRRLQALGARRLGGLTDGGRRSVTLADPEGNAFDLVAA